ncbi:MAG: hypothetical protein AAFR52_12520 [Pseudomonadota bacterium]
MFSDVSIDRARALKLFVGALVAVHAAWIGIHAWMITGDRINTWRLGGYAMYTRPPPQSQVHVYGRGASGDWVGLEGGAFRIFEFYEGNDLNVFRCAPPPEAALAGFFDQNPSARGRRLRIALSEAYMTRDPFHVGRRIYATIDMAWRGETVTWTHAACDETHEGQFAYRP